MNILTVCCHRNSDNHANNGYYYDDLRLLTLFKILPDIAIL